VGNSFKYPGDYRIEISGWWLNNDFFAEKTDLLWTAGGEKQVQLHRALTEGAIVIIRLLASEPSSGSVPVAYQVQDVVPMNCNGRCQMKLAQLHPTTRESLGRKNASNVSEDSERVCDVQEFEELLQHEEILQ
jgi:hypothetical protein